MLKKICAALLLSCMMFTGVYAAEPPVIAAKGAILAESKSGEILFEQNADEKLFPASTTKLMTALVALEKANPDDVVTVNAESIKDLPSMGSSVYLIPGEQIQFMDLMRYMLVASGNDACDAIAAHVAGSVADFVTMMNSTAQELGCTNTNFTNPHGLHNENHYTSARDLLKITQKAMENPVIAEIVKMTSVKLPKTNKHPKETTINTTNHLISKAKDKNYFYESAIGIKTGSTTPAGLCLIAGATKDDLTYYSVVLGAAKGADGKLGSFTETVKLLDYGRNNFSVQLLSQSTDPICEVKIGMAAGKDTLVLNPEDSFSALLPNDFDKKEIKLDYKTNEDIKAPIAKGDKLGTITYSYGGKTYGTMALVASEAVDKSRMLGIVDSIGNFFGSKIFKIAVAVIMSLILLFVAYVFIVRTQNKKRRRRRGNQGRYRK